MSKKKNAAAGEKTFKERPAIRLDAEDDAETQAANAANKLQIQLHFSALMARLAGTDMEIDEAAQGRVLAFLNILSKYNQKVNLVGNSDPYSLVERHAADALSLVSRIKAEMATSKAPNQRVRYLDIGTGGGLPGMIVALACPLLKATLLDATLKKCNFLQFAIDQLGMGEQIEVINGRAEDGAREHDMRERYKFVTARAVGTLKLTAELAVPFLKPGGYFIAQKTQSRIDAEVKESREILLNMGAEIQEIIPVEGFPELSEALIVPVLKLHTTPQKYPREWKLIAPNK